MKIRIHSDDYSYNFSSFSDCESILQAALNTSRWGHSKLSILFDKIIFSKDYIIFVWSQCWYELNAKYLPELEPATYSCFVYCLASPSPAGTAKMSLLISYATFNNISRYLSHKCGNYLIIEARYVSPIF